MLKRKKMGYTNTSILKNSDINFHSHTILQQRHTYIHTAKTLKNALILVHYKLKKTQKKHRNSSISPK